MIHHGRGVSTDLYSKPLDFAILVDTQSSSISISQMS